MLTSFNKELYEKELKEEAIAAGLKEGQQLGLLQGLQQGHDNLLISLVQKKLAKNYSIAEIADALEQPIEIIQSIIEKLQCTKNE